MFAKAYVKIGKEKKGTHVNKFESQTIKAIWVGKCPKSDRLLFYHPESKTILTDADGHRFDNFSPSGPQFGLDYDGGSHCQRNQICQYTKNHNMSQMKQYT